MKVKNYIITAVVTLSLAVGISAYAHGPGGSSGNGSATDSGGYGMMGGSGMMGMMGGNNMMEQSGSTMMPQNKYMPDMNQRNRHTDNMPKYDQKKKPQDMHSDGLNETDLNHHNQNNSLENNPS